MKRLFEIVLANNQTGIRVGDVAVKQTKKHTPMLYNTDISLWENYRNQRIASKRPQQFNIWDGMVSDGTNVLARFADQTKAIAALKKAGWKVKSQGKTLPHLASTS